MHAGDVISGKATEQGPVNVRVILGEFGDHSLPVDIDLNTVKITASEDFSIRRG